MVYLISRFPQLLSCRMASLLSLQKLNLELGISLLETLQLLSFLFSFYFLFWVVK